MHVGLLAFQLLSKKKEKKFNKVFKKFSSILQPTFHQKIDVGWFWRIKLSHKGLHSKLIALNYSNNVMDNTDY